MKKQIPSAANVHLKSLTPRLATADLQRAVRFYSEHLGFLPCVLWPKDRPTFCVLQRDGVQVAFHESPERTVSDQEMATELYFEVSDVQSAHAALKEKIAAEWGPDVYSYGRREFAFRDADGYLIIFSEPTGDPPTCPDACE